MSYFDRVDPIQKGHVCNRCGAFVMLTGTHEAWHRVNDVKGGGLNGSVSSKPTLLEAVREFEDRGMTVVAARRLKSESQSHARRAEWDDPRCEMRFSVRCVLVDGHDGDHRYPFQESADGPGTDWKGMATVLVEAVRDVMFRPIGSTETERVVIMDVLAEYDAAMSDDSNGTSDG